MSPADPPVNRPLTEEQVVTGPARTVVIFAQKSILILARAWYFVAMMAATVILALAFLAPAFMSSGPPEAGLATYRLLAPHDHQLPQRSDFLFGRDGGIHSYSLEQVLGWGADPEDLRAFVGNPEIGFKMALNQRMTAIFLAICLGGLIWKLAGDRPRLRVIPFILMTMPLLLDGFSHRSSEILGDGLREANRWAVVLTFGLFPDGFYVGDTIGTLNWLLRTVTGFIFGLGLAWFLFTYLDNRFKVIRRELEPKLRRIGAIR
jgi:hypothetical protein